MLYFDNENIRIIFSDKSDGNMLFGKPDSTDFDADALINKKVVDSRLKFFANHQIDPARLSNIWGVHGSDIYRIHGKDLGKGALNPQTRVENYDGLITDVKNSYLMITGADCLPVLFYDERHKAIGATHTGWRGVIKEIVPKMIARFSTDFRSDPTDIKAWIGPGIKACHYDVPEERAELFSKKYAYCIMEKDGRFFLDLAGAIALQLTGVGVNPQNIVIHQDCTYCEKDKWFSARRDKPERIEAAAFIMHLKPQIILI